MGSLESEHRLKFLKMKFYIAVVVIACALFHTTSAQCMAKSTCLDEKSGIHYKNGQKWSSGTCMDCSCSTTKRLLKTCDSWMIGPITQTITVKQSEADDVESNRLLRCKVITDEEAAGIHKFRVVNFHADCEAKFEDECRYDVVDRETGEKCDHPFGMVG